MSALVPHLKPHQQGAVKAVCDAYMNGVTRPVVVLPTGAGKTVVTAAVVKKFLGAGERFLFCVHRAGILEQAADEFAPFFPGEPMGLLQGEHDSYADRFVFASWQTLGRPNRLARYLSKGKPAVIVTDEAHHVPADSYLRTLEQLVDDDTLVLAVTATPGRTDNVSLRVFFQELVYSISMLELIDVGWLCDLRRVTVETDLDLSGVRVDKGGDFNQKQLEVAVSKSGNRHNLIVEAVRAQVPGLPGIYFGASVADAEAFCDVANANGIACALVVDKTPELERKEIFERYRNGELQYLSNVMVLTEGYNFPWSTVAIIGRHTRQQGLYQQMVGRIARVLDEDRGLPIAQRKKREAIILDVADNRHTVLGLHDLIGVTERQLGKKTVRQVAEEQKAKAAQAHLPEEVALGTGTSFQYNSLFSQGDWKQVGPLHVLREDGVGRVEIAEDMGQFRVSFHTPGGKMERLNSGRTVASLDKAKGYGEEHVRKLRARAERRADQHSNQQFRNQRASDMQQRKLRGLYPLPQNRPVTQGEVWDAWDAIRRAKEAGHKSWWDYAKAERQGQAAS